MTDKEIIIFNFVDKVLVELNKHGLMTNNEHMHQSHIYSAIQIAFDKTDIIKKDHDHAKLIKDDELSASPVNNKTICHGLKKREQFAAMALQGLLANDAYVIKVENMVKNSVTYADALINELEK